MKAIDTILKRTTKNTDDTPKNKGSSKFDKSLKTIVKHERKKVNFDELKSDGIKGDAVYEGQKDRVRDKKAARKETEK